MRKISFTKTGPKVKFCIIFPERSGSTWLVTMLSGHKDIFCDHEIFYLEGQYRTGNAKRPQDLLSPRKNLALINNLYRKQKKVVGFKFKYPSQINIYKEITNFLLEKKDNIKIIFLYRQNTLKQAISRQNMSKIKEHGFKWENAFKSEKSDFDPLKDFKVDIDRAIFDTKINEKVNKDIISYIKKFANVLTITYEDLLYENSDTMAKVFGFLNVDKIEASGGTHKITDDDLESSITNYEDLKKAVDEAGFSVFLDKDWKKYPRLDEHLHKNSK